ncbi:MAG: signal peptidase II [Gemmatimonadaceae bacterium]
MPDRYRDVARLAIVGLVVASVDLFTKGLAALLLSGPRSMPDLPGNVLHFALVHNNRMAFGLSLGGATTEASVILTLFPIGLAVLICRELAAIDRAAPVALGLIAGAAIGNLTSLLSSPLGVLDFIAVDAGAHEVVMNVADIAAYTGLALLLRTGFRVSAALRTQRRTRTGTVVPAIARERWVSPREAPREVVVALAVHREPDLERPTAPAPAKAPPTDRSRADLSPGAS